MTLVFYPLTFAVGLATLRGSFAALAGGAALTAGWTVTTLLITTGQLRFDAMSPPDRDVYAHYHLATLLLLLAAIGNLLYTVALVARIDETRRRRRDAQSRGD
jgi:hypothetical protein